MMAPLLTLTQQQAIKKITGNYKETDYNQLAIEVEENELLDLLGAALLQDVQDNPGSVNNLLLLNGSTFDDRYGNTIKHKGLRYILAYMNYSKYIGESYVKDTMTGFVKKNRQEAEHLTEGERLRLQIDNRKLALKQWELTKMFLDENNNDFSLWNCTNTRKPYKPKFKGIKRTLSNKEYEWDRKLRRYI